MDQHRLRIATRHSDLALWQASHVAGRLQAVVPGLEVELVHVTTTGDRDRVHTLREFGGAGVFTREVQRAVLDGRADVAVHSLKDLPTEPAAGLVLAAVPDRASPFDVLILPDGAEPLPSLDDLPQGAHVATGSLRRQAQLLCRRPDLRLVEIRGNVPTRIAKLDRGEYDAIVLAEAGLGRLGLKDRISLGLRPPLMFPAVGQGALGIECRTGDDATRASLERIIDHSAFAAVRAERTVLRELRAGCHAPLGVHTLSDGTRLTLEAVVLSPDGRERLHDADTGSTEDPESLGRTVARRLQRQGADRLVATG
ncbi:MAG TPA: hydroxymethylbilane synthase [Planctomycetaceae bacterium]|nr:hydroxymethylbilane synthase [Planctomycetaceae bacterium]